MFNRIRRAVSRTSERYVSTRRRRRRPLTPLHPTVVHPTLAEMQPTRLTGRRRGCTDNLAGEETALVRPYVLALEAERQRAVVSHVGPFDHTCFALAEAF